MDKTEKYFKEKRESMVISQIQSRGITDPRVISAMKEVERHKFVKESDQKYAYEDYPLSIDHEQTISQPYIVALMTELLCLKKTERVLEVGTGCGYQSAVLALMAAEVFSIEIVKDLAVDSAIRLKKLGYLNVNITNGNGYNGWQEYAPYDAIMVTAACSHVPKTLLEQLAEKGRMVMPVGKPYEVQQLKKITKEEKNIRIQDITSVRFVPMTGSLHA